MLLAGGGVQTGPNTSTVSQSGELLATDGNVFTPAGTMTVKGRIFGAATLLPDGDVLLAGGDTKYVAGTPALKSAEVWSPNGGGGGTFTATTYPMHVARQAFTLTTLPNGLALAVGGSPAFNSPAGSRTAELYNPATGRWTLTGSLPSGRLGHTATLLPNCKVLIVGDAPAAVTYNYVTGRFSAAGSEGSFQRSYQTATLLANGKVLIAGGETVTTVALKTASVYNPATGRFTPTSSMPTAHSQGFAALISGGRVIVGGGLTGTAPNQNSNDHVEIYSPTNNTWATADPLLAQSFAFNVQSDVLQGGDLAVMGTGAGNQSELYTPTPLGPPPSTPAQNCSDLTAILSTSTAPKGVVTVKAGVPAAGSLKATATVPVQKGVKTAFAYGSATANASHWGGVPLTIKPGSHASSVLHTRGTLRVNVTVTFTPTHGSVATRTASVTAQWA